MIGYVFGVESSRVSRAGTPPFGVRPPTKTGPIWTQMIFNAGYTSLDVCSSATYCILTPYCQAGVSSSRDSPQQPHNARLDPWIQRMFPSHHQPRKPTHQYQGNPEKGSETFHHVLPLALQTRFTGHTRRSHTGPQPARPAPPKTARLDPTGPGIGTAGVLASRTGNSPPNPEGSLRTPGP